jgi:hypothetical protein
MNPYGPFSRAISERAASTSSPFSCAFGQKHPGAARERRIARRRRHQLRQLGHDLLLLGAIERAGEDEDENPGRWRVIINARSKPLFGPKITFPEKY